MVGKSDEAAARRAATGALVLRYLGDGVGGVGLGVGWVGGHTLGWEGGWGLRLRLALACP
jgi:hypothetical protein